GQWVGAWAITLALPLGFAGNAWAQNQSGGQPAPAPTPASASGPTTQATDPLVSLILVAEALIPKLQDAIESPLVAGLENLAFWIAVVVMMLSFARLFRENDGASRDLFASAARSCRRRSRARISAAGSGDQLRVQAKSRSQSTQLCRSDEGRGTDEGFGHKGGQARTDVAGRHDAQPRFGSTCRVGSDNALLN